MKQVNDAKWLTTAVTAAGYLYYIFGSVKEPKESLCVSVCPFGTKCSKSLNLHISFIGQLQVSYRSVSDQSQVSFRSVSGLSVLTLSDRRSLKYYILLAMKTQLYKSILS